MAVSPDQDKTAFWNRIRGDPWIQKALKIEGQPDSVASTKIRKERTVDDTELNGDVRFILIFDPPSNEVGGPFEQSVIEVDVLMPSTKQPLCDDTLSQVVALCGINKEINGKTIERIIKAGSLACAPGFFRTGARFYYYSSTITQIKKL